MLKFIFKKLLQMIPMMLLISFLVFGALQLTGIDPVSYIATPDMAANQENLDMLRERLGLNQPFLIRYFNWVWGILRGDFGYSIANGTSIRAIIAARLPATIELALVALLFSSVLGISIGIISAIHQNSIIDYLGRFFAVLGQAIPQFFFGICLIQIFSIKLGWLPSSGRYSTYATPVQHFILPALTLTLSMTAVLMRYSRNNMLGVLNSDYIKTARMKGISETKVYVKHAFRNALRPVLVIICFRLPILISGSVVIESVYNWPGIGTVITDAVVAGDFPVVMVTTLMVAASILIASFLVDVLTAALDPRVRLGDD